MCGIVGYVGHREAMPILLEGLRRLEYRGYDSAGIVTMPGRGHMELTRAVGRIEQLASRLKQQPVNGSVGIGHTRWATHGAPTEANAHPHLGGEARLALAHNGVIENYEPIKQALMQEGYQFQSATDSEVIAHLIDSYLSRLQREEFSNNPHELLVEAVRESLRQLRGTYGIVVLFRDYPDILVAARLGSPLVVGVGNGEHLVASDGAPLAGHTDQIVYLADHQVACLTPDTLQVHHRDEGPVIHQVDRLEIECDELSLQGYPHYMLKEIFEQPRSLLDTMRGRLCGDDATAVFGGPEP